MAKAIKIKGKERDLFTDNPKILEAYKELEKVLKRHPASIKTCA